MPAKIEYKEGQSIGPYGVTFIKELKQIVNKRNFLFRCECGVAFQAIMKHVKAGNVRSCGCYHRKKVSTANGDTNKNSACYYLHVAWENMHQRCRHARAAVGHSAYKDIEVYKEWDSYLVFKTYVLDMLGHRPTTKHSIDRIKNKEDYKPGNIRWATSKEQCNNRG